jgi:hypothetical protein
VTTKHLADGIAADYGSDGKLAGIEVLDAIKRFGDKATLQQVIPEGLEPAASIVREKPDQKYGKQSCAVWLDVLVEAPTLGEPFTPGWELLI